MLERELKLHVPFSARSAIARYLRAHKARRVSLQARYFDTPNRDLAHAGIALRLRKEGRRWVQTLKAPGTDVLSRLEINHVRPTPVLDVSLYAGTAVEAILAGLPAPLTLRYETQVTRLVLRVESEGAEVEIAYDQGFIFAGEAELPVSEVEFEHVAGDVHGIFRVAGQWLQEYGLVLDTRSKAERGDALAGIALQATAMDDGRVNVATVAAPDVTQLFPARRAGPVRLKPKMSVTQAYLLTANECLAQVIQNAAFASGVDTQHASKSAHMEYIHQLRVGIRRLRSCWKLFRDWVPAADDASIQVLRDGFARLGDSRDTDVVTLVVGPKLRAAGMPECTFARRRRSSQTEDPVASGSAFQQALLAFLEQLVAVSDALHTPRMSPSGPESPKAETPDTRPDEHETPAMPVPRNVKAALSPRLHGWLAKVAKQGAKLTRLPIEKQHDVRKAVKTLRYCLDFSEDVLPGSKALPLRALLSDIQEELGDLNDYYVADEHYQRLLEKQPQAWFAVGWLRAMQEQQRWKAQRLFKKLVKLEGTNAGRRAPKANR